MVQTAILQSGILQQFTEIDLRENKVVKAQPSNKLTDRVKAGDRIEIYRPLLSDPKEIRRKRAEQQLLQQQAQKQTKKSLKQILKEKG